MNAVGIDVSKGKSMVCVMRPFGEVVLEPFEVYIPPRTCTIWRRSSKLWTERPALFWKPPGITTNRLLSFYTMRAYLFP